MDEADVIEHVVAEELEVQLVLLVVSEVCNLEEVVLWPSLHR